MQSAAQPVVQQTVKPAVTAPRRTLSSFPFNASSVLPYYIIAGNRLVMLGRESHGQDAGTWDAFGGKKDPGEKHPESTAAREFAEETKGLIMDTKKARQFLKTTQAITIVASSRKNAVIYIAPLDSKEARYFEKHFYTHKTTKREQLEKDAIATVKWDTLASVIAHAPRNSVGSLKLPITIQAFVIKKNGDVLQETILLRPYFVSAMQPYFKDVIDGTKTYNIKQEPQDPRARFYD